MVPSGSIHRISASTPIMRSVREVDRPAGSAASSSGSSTALRSCVTNCSLAEESNARAPRRARSRPDPDFLLSIHRGLGVAEQRRRGRRVLWEQADPHTRRDVELGLGDHERRRQRLVDVLRDRLGADHRGVQSPRSSRSRSASSSRNWSPPRRATRSVSRVASRSRSATATSSSSPAAWPRRVVHQPEVVEVDAEHRDGDPRAGVPARPRARRAPRTSTR